LPALQAADATQGNLAALGELCPAGIAHEFKNGPGHYFGYAQMIRAEELGSEASDYADHILEQTAASPTWVDRISEICPAV